MSRAPACTAVGSFLVKGAPNMRVACVQRPGMLAKAQEERLNWEGVAGADSAARPPADMQ